jgi:hypothetical protein
MPAPPEKVIQTKSPTPKREASRSLRLFSDYISMPPGIARGLSSSCSSEINASVVSISPAIEAAFC